MVCPQCRIVKKGNFSRNRVLEDISRKLLPKVAGFDETTTQESIEVAEYVEVPEVRLPTYDI